MGIVRSERGNCSVARKRIMVVEDEQEIRRLMSFHISISGYDTVSVSDGAEAVKSIREKLPDLIVLDILMPRMNGWELLACLRREFRGNDIPVIVVSALGEVDDKLRAFASGAEDYMTKPFSPRELVARIQRILERRGDAGTGA
ncbi:MAG: response regulator [Candidatus Omnitrophota bacterium]|jgi:DNA-binding response OmpR family regulator|nr:response regulator [Candidatus Omnitrophota bacterium]